MQKSPLKSPIELAQAYMTSRIVISAVNLGLFDSLSRAPKTVEELSTDLALSSRGANALLHALAALGLLEKEGDRFANSPDADTLLVSDRPRSQVKALLYFGSLWEAWSNLEHAVRHGVPPRELDTGGALEADGRQDPERIRCYLHAMDVIARPTAEELANRLDLTNVRSVLDLGGGLGTYSIALVQKNPAIKATVFELPMVSQVALARINEIGMQGSIYITEGDALKDDFGTGYDLVLVSQLLHTYAPDDCAAIVQKSAAALAPDGCLIINEFVLNDDRISPPWAAIFAVNMLVNNPAGTVYTADEICHWLLTAGLRDIRSEDLGRSRMFLARI